MINKNKIIKEIGAIMLSIAMLTTGSINAFAETSDEVTLSISVPGAGYVTSSNGLNVRSGASTSSCVLTALPYGTKIMIVERCSNGWDIVQYDTNGNYGYVSASYIREYDLDYYCTVSAGGSLLNLRSGMGTSYSTIVSIPSGRSFPELVDTGTWDYVLYGNRDGYVNAGYITKTHY